MLPLFGPSSSSLETNSKCGYELQITRDKDENLQTRVACPWKTNQLDRMLGRAPSGLRTVFLYTEWILSAVQPAKVSCVGQLSSAWFGNAAVLHSVLGYINWRRAGCWFVYTL
jgi:hypothetical protein